MESLLGYASGSDSDAAAEHARTTVKRRRTTSLTSPTRASHQGGAQPESREIAADGRVRGFPHREGQFAATVFVPVRIVAGDDLHALLASVRRILRDLKLPSSHHSPSANIAGAQHSECANVDGQASTSVGSALAASGTALPSLSVADEADCLSASALAAGWRLFGNDELHISLSRCVALKQPQLDAFLAEVKRAVSSSIRCDHCHISLCLGVSKADHLFYFIPLPPPPCPSRAPDSTCTSKRVPHSFAMTSVRERLPRYPSCPHRKGSMRSRA